jgi:hypothetical protein
MIDIYAAAGTFADIKKLGTDAAALVKAVEQDPKENVPGGQDMSLRDGKTEGTAGTRDNFGRPGALHWDVFVTPGIAIVTRDKPSGVRETFFQATASTLIYGVRDAVLVDAFMTVEQANALAGWPHEART